jgi:predicted Kef-type K+ transport protein
MHAYNLIGVILLMFGVGLQFHIEELLAVRRVAVPGAILQFPRRDGRADR